MGQEDTIPPAGLHPRLVRRLLDNLESNDDFRKLFQESPEKALRSIGYTDPWACLSLKSGTKLASPQQIKAERNKLEDNLTSIHYQSCDFSKQESAD